MVRVPFAMAAALTAAVAHAQTSPAPEMPVTEAAGVYRVSAVLTDYESIPEFMPDVKTASAFTTCSTSVKPSFDVPGFVLKRLFKRDAAMMIERLQAEIASRAPAR